MLPLHQITLHVSEKIFQKRLWNLIIIIDAKIRDEKLPYKINRDATRVSALSSEKMDKYEYLTGEEILPSNRKQIIELAKFTFCSLGEPWENKQKNWFMF